MDQKHFKLFIALPTYGGNMSANTCNSLIKLTTLLTKKKIEYDTYFIVNESLIQRARNTLANNFLEKTDCTHLLFIDSDIEFDPEDVLRMVACDKDIIGGIYPVKEINWNKMKDALLAHPNLTPTECSHIAARMAYNSCITNSTQIDISQPIEVNEIATGFLLIHRSVFEKYKQVHSEFTYKKLDSVHNTSEMHVSYFNVRVDSEHRLISEDYAFCMDARALGFKVFAAPWVHLGHVGTYKFECSLVSTAKYLSNN